VLDARAHRTAKVVASLVLVSSDKLRLHSKAAAPWQRRCAGDICPGLAGRGKGAPRFRTVMPAPSVERSQLYSWVRDEKLVGSVTSSVIGTHCWSASRFSIAPTVLTFSRLNLHWGPASRLCAGSHRVTHECCWGV
jgi:hypothetical protein